MNFTWALRGQQKQVAILRKQLDFHRSRLSLYGSGNSGPAFVGAMDEFLNFMSNYHDADAYAAFENTSNFADYQRFFIPYLLRIAWDMEDLSLDEMMSHELQAHQKLGEIMGSHTRGAYTRMQGLLKLVDISHCQTFVLLGCGKVPSGLFYMHDWTDLPLLVGVDNHPSAVEKAQQLVDRFHLHRIRIMEDDAADFDLSEFDVIYWGNFCTPRLKVMERIIASARPDSIIILRDPFFTGTLGTERVRPFLDPHFEICAESEEFAGRFMLKHYILRLRTGR